MNVLIDSSVKVSLMVLIGLGARLLLRRQSAAARHWVLAVAIGCAVVIPLLAAVVPAWYVGLPALDTTPRPVEADTPVSTVTIASTVLVAPGRSPAVSPTAGTGTSTTGAWALAGAVWLTGAAGRLLILLIGLAHLTWLASRARRVHGGRWSAMAGEIATSCGLRRPVTILESDHPTLLVTWGLIFPKVILPASARDWSDDRVRIVLRHELAHIQRKDWPVFMAAELLRALYWFNPLVWAACRRVRQDSENACDDAVLNAGISGPDYAVHLLDLARSLHANRRRSWPSLPAPAMARPSSLHGRISAMLNISANRHPLTKSIRVASVAALLAVTVLVAGLGAQRFYTFAGSVLDSTNRFLPDTRLVLTNAVSRAKYEIRSDRSGRFEFVGLPPGDYALEASVPGFRTFKDTVPIVARDIDRTIALEVGSLEETITVTTSLSAAPDESTAEQSVRLRERRERAAVRQQAAVDKCIAGATGANGAGGAIGGQILAPLKLTSVNPQYPETSRAAGIGGVVTMEAVIGPDGNVQDVRAVDSPNADLAAAAAEAVRQWQFTPTLLNCVPTEVQMKVTTNFRAQP